MIPLVVVLILIAFLCGFIQSEQNEGRRMRRELLKLDRFASDDYGVSLADDGECVLFEDVLACLVGSAPSHLPRAHHTVAKNLIFSGQSKALQDAYLRGYSDPPVKYNTLFADERSDNVVGNAPSDRVDGVGSSNNPPPSGLGTSGTNAS